MIPDIQIIEGPPLDLIGALQGECGVMPLMPFGFGCDEENSHPITINCEELNCDQLQINYEEFVDNEYEINTENELEVKIEGIVQDRVKNMMDEIMNRVATNVV
jgi:hypothetical protein